MPISSPANGAQDFFFRFATDFLAVFVADFFAEDLSPFPFGVAEVFLPFAVDGFVSFGTDLGIFLAIAFAFAPATPPTTAPTAAPSGPTIDPAAAPAAAPPTIPKPDTESEFVAPFLDFAIEYSFACDNEVG
jgi:hypothetical protein